MAGVVFVIGRGRAEHWARAMEASFWETEKEFDVRPGDTLLFWVAPTGIAGLARATRPTQPVDYSREPRPWLESDERNYKHRYYFELLSDALPTGVKWSDLVAGLGRPGRPAHSPVPFDYTIEQVRAVLLDLSSPAGTEVEYTDRHRGGGGRYRRALLGTYRDPDPSVTTKQGRVFTRDPHEYDRGLSGHRETQIALANWLREEGIEPEGPGAVNVDIAWRVDGVLYVAEVKSLTRQNERNQIRIGIGEVIDFAHRLEGARRVLVVENEPDGMWTEVCRSAEVQLVWPGVFERLLPWR